MRKKRNNRRRRHGRLSFLWKPLCGVIAVAAMFVAVTFFFRLDQITVTGMSRYTEQEVLDASGLQLGGNLYFINKFEVKKTMFARLPYVEEIRINRRLPDTLLIEVRECTADAAVKDGDGYWLISSGGKLLEHTPSLAAPCPVIEGGALTEPEAAAQAVFDEEIAYRAGVAMTLLREAKQRGMLDKIVTVDLSDDTALNMAYLYRFTVRIPWTADVGYKLETLDTVVNYLEKNETGRIDLMTEGKASFIPQ